MLWEYAIDVYANEPHRKPHRGTRISGTPEPSHGVGRLRDVIR